MLGGSSASFRKQVLALVAGRGSGRGCVKYQSMVCARSELTDSGLPQILRPDIRGVR